MFGYRRFVKRFHPYDRLKKKLIIHKNDDICLTSLIGFEICENVKHNSVVF